MIIIIVIIRPVVTTTKTIIILHHHYQGREEIIITSNKLQPQSPTIEIIHRDQPINHHHHHLYTIHHQHQEPFDSKISHKKQQQQVSEKPELRRSTRQRQPIDRWVSMSIAIASQYEIQQSDVSDAFTYVDIDDECMNAYTSQFDEFTGLMDYADPSVYSYLNDRA